MNIAYDHQNREVTRKESQNFSTRRTAGGKLTILSSRPNSSLKPTTAHSLSSAHHRPPSHRRREERPESSPTDVAPNLDPTSARPCPYLTAPAITARARTAGSDPTARSPTALWSRTARMREYAFDHGSAIVFRATSEGTAHSVRDPPARGCAILTAFTADAIRTRGTG